MQKKVTLVILLLVIALVGILLIPRKPVDQTQSIIESCKNLCVQTLNSGMDLTNGPCLSDNNPDWTYEDWVCDVAHWPREDVDNQPENQCQEFRSGNAHHFVEVNPSCEYIRHY